MLYDLWLETVKDHAGDLAVVDLISKQRWTFSQLADAVQGGHPDSSAVVFPKGGDIRFILDLLSAWRFGQIVCPLDHGQVAPVFPTVPPKKIVHLKTTSATTGVAKCIAFTSEQLIADARNIVQTMRLRPDIPNLGVISLAHSYGFSNLVLPLLLHGVPLALLGAPLPEVLRSSAEMFGKVTLPAVPALWKTWLDAGAIPRNVHTAISAGAVLPLEVESKVFDQFGLKIHNFYGSSETGGIAYDASDLPRGSGAIVGRAMEGVDVSIGQNGCIVVSGAAVAEGYWPSPSPDLGNGRFQTSDLGEIIGGRLHLNGRAGDLINVAGRKVTPETIETLLASYPGVSGCVVFGIQAPDMGRGDRIVACIGSAGGELDRDGLKSFLETRLPAWQIPREWVFFSDLVPTSRGKISRGEWRKRYLAERALMM